MTTQELIRRLDTLADAFTNLGSQIRYAARDLEKGATSGTQIRYVWDNRNAIVALCGKETRADLRELWLTHFATEPPRRQKR